MLDKNSHKLLVESASEVLFIWWLKCWSSFTFLMFVKVLNILLVTGAGSALQRRARQKFSDGAVLRWKIPLVQDEDAVPRVYQLHGSPRGS